MISQELRRFVNSNFLFGRGDTSFGDDESFLESGIIDSTGVLELVEFIEQKFEIKVRDQDLVPENLDTINRLVGYIRRRRAAAGECSVAGASF